jgi:hypothetical protein
MSIRTRRLRPGASPLPRSPRPMRASRCLSFDTLEWRLAPSATLLLDRPAGPILTQAADIGLLDGSVSVAGAIDAGAEVDWYGFTLDRPAAVTLSATSESDFAGVLTLYNNDLYDYGDLQNPLGYRRLAQHAAAPDSAAELTEVLGAGSYFVAVSGAGNRYFHPLLADSGDIGSSGSYELSFSARPLDIDTTTGAVVLRAEPGAGEALAGAPLVLRLEFSTALDPWSVAPWMNMTLTHNATGAFGDGSDLDVPIAFTNVSVAGTELQIFPAMPLAPGAYRLLIVGDPASGLPTVNDLGGLPLGRDYQHFFEVAGSEGQAPDAPANDSAAGALELGDVAGLVQVEGVIGDDPLHFSPGADVDLYHFQVAGAGTFQLLSEVFAGRIGSPLDPGLSLFRLDPASGRLEHVAGNDNTLNPTPSDGGFVPLFTDAVLFAGLTEGDYYLAVSSTFNVPDKLFGLLPGGEGIFDPNESRSGVNGFSTGPYVLSVFLRPDEGAPSVVSTSIAAGAVLDSPPTRIEVEFDRPVNLQELAYATFLATADGRLDAVFVSGSDGVQYHPRLETYDPLTGRAIFMFYDAVPAGPAELHLSGPLGLASLGGVPLGDHVVPFSVAANARSSAPAPLVWEAREPNDSALGAQELGPIFPRELGADSPQGNGIAVVQVGAAGAGDFYRFEILQPNHLFVSVHGPDLPAGVSPQLLDAGGNVLPAMPQGDDGRAIMTQLDAGVYFVVVSGWTLEEAVSLQYELRISALDAIENPTPLTIGPAPALRLRLVTIRPSTDPVNPGPDSPAPTRPGAVVEVRPVAAIVEAAPAVALAHGPSEGGPSSNTPGTPRAPGPVEASITPVSPPAAGAAAAPSLPRPSVDLPRGVVAALSHGPVGGVRATPTELGAAQLWVRIPTDSVPPASLALGQLAQLLFVIQTDFSLVPTHEDDADAPAAADATDVPAPVQESRSVAPASSTPDWAPLVDVLLRMSEWLLPLAPQQVEASRAPAAPAAPRQAGRPLGAAAAIAAVGGLIAIAPHRPTGGRRQEVRR